MAESEDPVMLAERLFEQTRRFTDSWLLNVRHVSGRQTLQATNNCRPCQVQLLRVHHEEAQSLFHTPNPAFNKLAALLVHLIERINVVTCKLNDECCPKLLVFGEEPQLGNSSREGDSQLLLAKMLPFLKQTASLLDSLAKLLENLLLQLGSLCAEHTRKATILQGGHARAAFAAVADSLGALLRIELVTTRNSNLASAFAMFFRMLQSVAGEARDFDEHEMATAKQLQHQVGFVQEQVMGKGAFKKFMDFQTGRGSEIQAACGSPSFTTAASAVLRQRVTEITARVLQGTGSPGDNDKLLGAVAFGALIFRLGEKSSCDKRLLRQLLDLHTQIPLLPVHSELVLQPASFLSQYLPTSLDSYIPAAYARQAAVLRSQQLDQSMGQFSSRLEHSALAVAAWICRLKLLIDSPKVTESLLTQMVAAVVQGLSLAAQIRNNLLDILGQLKLSNAAIGKPSLRILLHATCQIKAIENTFCKFGTALAEALPHLVTHVKSEIQGLLSALAAGVRAKSKQTAGSQSLMSSKAKRDRMLLSCQDATVAIDAGHQIAQGPATIMQLTSLEVCLDAVATTGAVSEGDLQRLHDRLANLRQISALEASLSKATDCSFLYFNRDLLSAGLKELLAAPEEARKLPLIVDAFIDGHSLLKHTILSPLETHQAYDADLQSLIRGHLLLPVCSQVEVQLRLQHHADQAAPAEQPSDRERTRDQDFTPILHLEPLRLLTVVINLRDFVERELSARFYNHTAVALHDWQTYSQLAALAHERMDILVEPPDLPGLIVDHGLSLLEVMQEMPAFAAGYAYSLVDQVFIQRAEVGIGTKHLMTLGVSQVVNSLRQQGASLADAAVNAAYRMLTRLFTVLSQWLAQDQVKSRLAKELRSVSECVQNEATPGYPYQWAETLAGDFRRLGSTADGSTYLDHLRRLVTEMGNLVALVRLIQQGKDRLTANAASFLDCLAPKKGSSMKSFSDSLQEDATEELRKSAKLLDAIANRILQGGNDEERPDYYTILVKVFSEQQHMQTGPMTLLHTVAPALSLNAVEAALLRKEQLPHRRRGSSPPSGFTDDGFSMGLAFLLRVAGQDEDFRRLRWFESVSSHFILQESDLKEGEAASQSTLKRWLGKFSGSEPLDPQAQNRELARARLRSYASEFKLLENVYSCASLLFCKQ